jgi:hypothetical protein
MMIELMAVFRPFSRGRKTTNESKERNQAMNDKATELDPVEPLAIEATELETITAGMTVRSGIHAGLQPCL